MDVSSVTLRLWSIWISNWTLFMWKCKMSSCGVTNEYTVNFIADLLNVLGIIKLNI